MLDNQGVSHFGISSSPRPGSVSRAGYGSLAEQGSGPSARGVIIFMADLRNPRTLGWNISMDGMDGMDKSMTFIRFYKIL